MAGTGEPVADLGVGIIDYGMAASALRASLPTIAWDRHPEATRNFADRGADVAGTAADDSRSARGHADRLPRRSPVRSGRKKITKRLKAKIWKPAITAGGRRFRDWPPRKG